ncbi:MAG: T9SS type A sorting domain-containing protein [Bacteroidia bacterium]
MKKAVSLLVSTIAILSLFSSGAKAQDSLLKWETYSENCLITNKIRIWLDSSIVDSAVGRFEVQYKNYAQTDTIELDMPYTGGSYPVGVYFKSDSLYKSFFTFINEKNNNNYLRFEKGLIDSASQKAKFTASFVDSNAILDSIHVSVSSFSTLNSTQINRFIVSDKDSEINGKIDFRNSYKAPPGKHRINFKVILKDGCVFENNLQLNIGNFLDLRINSKGEVIDSVYYWHRGQDYFCELAHWWDNTGCIDTNGFFYNPDSNVSRKNWDDNGRGTWYSPPKIREAIYYDFNSDGKIDSMRPVIKSVNWGSNSVDSSVRIPAKYQQDTLTVWSRDSLGQWQSSNPIPYKNCSYFKRHDYFDFEPYYGECQFSSNGNYKRKDTLHVRIRKLSTNGSDTSFTDYDAFSFQANTEIFKPLDYGHYIIERVTNNSVCDAPVYDTVVSCAGFAEIIEDSVFQDSLSIFNGFSSKSDSILIIVIDTLNNWKVVDSTWLSSGEEYLKVFPNGNYWVGFYSNTLDCGYERMWNLHNTSVYALNPNSMKIYPNPISNAINIESEFNFNSYHVLSVNGKLLSQGVIRGSHTVIDSSQLPKGLYIIKLEIENGEFITKQFVKI